MPPSRTYLSVSLRTLVPSSGLLIWLLSPLPLSAANLQQEARAILADKCFSCHGPDEQQRKAHLRLDSADGPFKDLGGYVAVDPGHPEKSELIRRIVTQDPDDLMPPPQSKLELSESERNLLVRWVQSGAPWQAHWAFIPPQKPEVPIIDSPSLPLRSPIDAFILQRLNQQSLSPSPEAEKTTLLRRVTLDLTGLPPTSEEIDEFLGNSAPDAYERVVDRLLASESHAERLAMEWMDVARYADSHGMHADGYRMMWPWRDWVIQSFHRNQPYDVFVTQQLAGDLLPHPTTETRLATAFHRNHPMTAEGGIVDEEFRLQYVIDRAQTTATAFLGLTLECARCHDHKFDPLTQKDFYRFSSFFNNINELGMTGDDDNYGPMLLLTSPETEQALIKVKQQLEKQIQVLATLRTELLENQSSEAPSLKSTKISLPAPKGYFPLDSQQEVALPDKPDKQELRLDGNLKAHLQEGAEFVKGVKGNAVFLDSEYHFITLDDSGFFELHDPFSGSLWIHPTQEGKIQTLMGTSGDKNNFWRGWEFYLNASNHLSLRLIHSLWHNQVDVQSQDPIPMKDWTMVSFTYDGSGKASGIGLYLNGTPLPLWIKTDSLYKSILPVQGNATRDKDRRPVRVGKSYRSFTGEYGIYKGYLDEISIFDTDLTAVEMRKLYSDIRGSDITSLPELPLDAYQEHQLNRHSPEYRDALSKLTSLRKDKLALLDPVPEIMVMEEMPQPRTLHVLKRGQYDLPQDPVEPGTPSSLPAFSDQWPKNRLGLSRWLFDPGNPLTARVTVNRYWQMIFGKGLVKTSEDFGTQGQAPTHPELLDWMAVSFQESGWNLRWLLREMVTSSTYRQSSKTTPEKREKDPLNLWYARSSSYRRQAEILRDTALSAAGILTPQVGGESVKPYQPEGLWIDKGNFSAKLLRYVPDKGARLYRRGLYTFIRRTSPPPAMTTFDQPSRDVCTVRREITNTPLQALILLNDPQFVEAARLVALRVLQHPPTDNTDDRIRYLFRTLLGRFPTPSELQSVTEYQQQQFLAFQGDPERVQALLTVGDYPTPETWVTPLTASLTVTANLLMNLDEFYMKR